MGIPIDIYIYIYNNETSNADSAITHEEMATEYAHNSVVAIIDFP